MPHSLTFRELNGYLFYCGRLSSAQLHVHVVPLQADYQPAPGQTDSIPLWHNGTVYLGRVKKNMFHVRVFQKKEEEGLFIFYFLFF